MTSESMQHYPVRLLSVDGREEVAEFAYRRAGGRMHLRVRSPSLPNYEFEDFDLFPCVIQLRKEIEPLGWRILCNAARLDASFGGMLRQTGSVLVNLLVRGEDGNFDVVRVHALNPALRGEIGSLDEQARHLEVLLDRPPGSLRFY